MTEEERNLLYVAVPRVQSGTLDVGPETSERCRQYGFIAAASIDDDANVFGDDTAPQRPGFSSGFRLRTSKKPWTPRALASTPSTPLARRLEARS